LSPPPPDGDRLRTRGADISAPSPDVFAETETHQPASSTEDSRDEPPATVDVGPPRTAAARDPTLPLIDGFDVLGRLGRGGMGVVYSARDRKLGRLVAIKALRAGTDATEYELVRFQKEARTIAQLRHPHIVQVFEVGESQGLVYLVLEFMNGGALSSFLDGTPLEPTLAAQIVAKLADGAAAAHRVGVVHRDLKPGNVLVSLDDELLATEHRRDATLLRAPGVVLKLADFGLAKSLGSDEMQTMSGMIVGTPRYSAPEQVRGAIREISPATDVYALGVILYECLTGTSVFRATGLMELLDEILNAEPLSPRTLQPLLNRDLETICLKCLRKSPLERYESAAALGDDLGRWLRREPILARPAGAFERALKWLRRNPGPTALAGVSLVAALATVALVVSMLFQSRLSRTNDDLTKARTELKGKNDELSRQNVQLESAKDKALDAEAEAARQRDLLARHRYAADMLSAGAAWRAGDIARVESLLDRNLPPVGAPASADLRGFEWRYLKGLTRSDLGRMAGEAAVYSPDATVMAVSTGGKVLLVDTDTTSVRPPRAMPGGPMTAYRLAFSADGRRLIAACQEQPAFRVWNVADGTLAQTFDKHSYLGGLALSPDGALALTTGFGNDRTAKLWKVDSGEVVFDWSAGAGGYAGDVAFSPDGGWYAVGWPTTQSIRIGHTATPNEFVDVRVAGSSLRFGPSSKRLFATLGERVGWIDLENLSPTSTLVATAITGSILDLGSDRRMMATAGADDRSLRIWDIASARLLNQRKGHVGGFKSFSFRGTTAEGVSVGDDHTIRFCRVLENQDFSLVPFVAPGDPKVKFSPDGKLLALAGGSPGPVLNDGQGFRALEPALERIWGLAFSPDGKWVAATSFNGRCRVWQVSDGDLAIEIEAPNHKPFFCVAFDAESKRLAIGGGDGYLPVWDLAEKREFANRSPGRDDVFFVAFRPGSDEMAASFNSSLLFTGKGTMRGWNGLPTNDLAFTPDGGGLLLTTSYHKEVTMFDADSRKILRVFSGHQGYVGRFSISADGSRLATCSPDGTAKLWDVASGQETLSLPVPDPRAIALSPDGRKLIVGTLQGELRVYDSTLGYDPANNISSGRK